MNSFRGRFVHTKEAVDFLRIPSRSLWATISIDHEIILSKPTISVDRFWVTIICGSRKGNSMSCGSSPFSLSYGTPRINVLTPVKVGDGKAGKLMPALSFLLQIDRGLKTLCWCGGRCFEARRATNSARKALTETTIMAMAASACSQNIAHAESIWPWLMFPPAILIIAVTMVKMLRQRTPQRANFRRREIWTFHSKKIGIEITIMISRGDVDSNK